MQQEILSILQLILTFGNVCILGYTLVKFLGKPHDSLDKRVTALEAWQVETNARLKHGSEKFDAQDKANEIILRSVLALIEFELDYCSTEHKPVSKSLEKAKDDLHEYLASK